MTGAPESGSKTTGTKGGDAPASQANGESKGPAPANAQADVPAPTPTPDDPPKPKSSSRPRGRRRKNEVEVAKAVAASAVTTIDGAAQTAKDEGANAPALEPVDPASTESPAPEPVDPATAVNRATEPTAPEPVDSQTAETTDTDAASVAPATAVKNSTTVTAPEPVDPPAVAVAPKRKRGRPPKEKIESTENRLDTANPSAEADAVAHVVAEPAPDAANAMIVGPVAPEMANAKPEATGPAPANPPTAAVSLTRKRGRLRKATAIAAAPASADPKVQVQDAGREELVPKATNAKAPAPGIEEAVPESSASKAPAAGPAQEPVLPTTTTNSEILLDLRRILATRDDKAIRKALSFYGILITATFLKDDKALAAALSDMHPDRLQGVYRASVRHGEHADAALSAWRTRFGDLWAGMAEPIKDPGAEAKARAFYAALSCLRADGK